MENDLTWQSIAIGQTFTSWYEFSPEKVDAFNLASGETHPLHADKELAQKSPQRARIISGLHLWVPVTQLLHRSLPRFIAREHEAKFPTSMYEGGTGYVKMTCTKKDNCPHVFLEVEVRKNARNRLVLEGSLWIFETSRQR